MRSRQVACLLIMVIMVPFYAACGEDPVAEKFERAEKELYIASSENDYEDVIAKFRGIYSEHPHTEWAPKALYRSGVVNSLYLKRYEDAVEDFAYLIHYYPNDELAFEAQTNIIDIYTDKIDNYAQAITEITKLIETYPDNDDIDKYQYKLARCYYSMRDFDQARLEYLILLDDSPRTRLRPQVYYEIANTYFVEGGGKLDKAIEYYRKLIDEYPSSELVMEAKFYSAAALEEKGELEEALKAYEELLPVYPNRRLVGLRIEGVKNIMQKKTSPAVEESLMGVEAVEEGTEEEGTSGTEDAIEEVGGSENGDGIIIKTPDKKKDTTPGAEKKEGTGGATKDDAENKGGTK